MHYYSTSTPSLDNPDAKKTPDETKSINYFYFSYDDSASTAGVELIKHALNSGVKPQVSWARAYEFLNYEKFDKSGQQIEGFTSKITEEYFGLIKKNGCADI